MDITEKIDTEETPQSRQRKKLAKQSAERKSSVKPKDFWFEQFNGKILKKTRMSNGNVNSEFVGKVKGNKVLVDELKKKYEVKVV